MDVLRDWTKKYTIDLFMFILKRKFSNLMLCYSIGKHVNDFYHNPKIKMIEYKEEIKTAVETPKNLLNVISNGFGVLLKFIF